MCLFVFLFSDVKNNFSDNMSEQVDMVEVKTEPNESEELFSFCGNANMVDNNSIQDKVTSESKNYN